ncbi:MAG: ABC transporter ATP-binding protein [Burkholderiales bacterium]|nr:ABC transporter ATP-binding protein [Burkholderiales bacterium]
MTPILRLEGINAWYGNVQALHGLDLTVARGGITALLGANGAGKTTTLRAIFNVMVRRKGTLEFDGASIAGLRAQDVVRLGISHVPDGRGTFAQLSVEENLRLGGYTLDSRGALQESMERVYQLFPKLQQRHRQQAGTLSGGEQQMLAIGRALMPKPRLILLDEPSFGLAPQIVHGIFDTLRAINQTGVSLLLVEQNVRLALNVATHACLIETGRVVRSGTAQDLAQDETVRRVYLGY